MIARRIVAAAALVVCALSLPIAQAGARNPDGQGFAALGRVISGMDVVRAIHKAPAEGENLTPPVTITRASRVVPQ